jgi:hypothetical protein
MQPMQRAGARGSSCSALAREAARVINKKTIKHFSIMIFLSSI